MNQVVSGEQLSDTEAESVAQAVDLFRAAPTSPQFFHAVPVRDPTGKLSEVRFYKDSSAQEPLAVIGISGDGAVVPMAWL